MAIRVGSARREIRKLKYSQLNVLPKCNATHEIKEGSINYNFVITKLFLFKQGSIQHFLREKHIKFFWLSG